MRDSRTDLSPLLQGVQLEAWRSGPPSSPTNAVDQRIFIGMLAIVAGAVVLSWLGQARFGAVLPELAALGACLAWGIDNNLTRKVSLTDGHAHFPDAHHRHGHHGYACRFRLGLMLLRTCWPSRSSLPAGDVEGKRSAPCRRSAIVAVKRPTGHR